MNQDLFYYAASSLDFIDDAKINDGEMLAGMLASTHKEIHLKDTPDSLYKSWKHSLPHLAEALKLGYATKGRIVILEYCIKNRGRIDAVICGSEKRYTKSHPNEYSSLAIIELKQWGGIEYRSSILPDSIEAYWGGKWHIKQHPCCQVLEYRMDLQELLNMNDIQEEIFMHPYAYLHNTYWQDGEEHDLFRGEKFADVIREAPLYTYRARRALGDRIRERTHRRDGNKTFEILTKKLK